MTSNGISVQPLDPSVKTVVVFSLLLLGPFCYWIGVFSFALSCLCQKKNCREERQKNTKLRMKNRAFDAVFFLACSLAKD